MPSNSINRGYRSISTPSERSFVVLALTVLTALAAALFGTHPGTALIVGAAMAGLTILILMVVRIEWGLYILAFTTVLSFFSVASNTFGLPTVENKFILFLVGYLLLRIYLSPGSLSIPRPTFYVLLAVGALMCLGAPFAERSDVVMAELLSFGFPALAVIFVAGVLVSSDILRSVVWSLIAGATFIGVVSAIQYFFGDVSVLSGFGQIEHDLETDGATTTRVIGPYEDPNFFAQGQVAILPLAWERLISEKSPVLKAAAGVAFMAIGLSIILSGSRGALIAAVVMFAVALYRSRISVKHAVVGLLVGLPLLALAPQSYLARVEAIYHSVVGEETVTKNVGGDGDRAISGRLDEMIAALHMFADNSIIGVGSGNYETHFRRYTLNHGLVPRHQARAAHSWPLEIAAEHGILGIIVYAYVFFKIFQSIRHSRDIFISIGRQDMSNLTVAFGMCILGLAITSIFLHLSLAKLIWILFGICLSLPVVAANEAARLGALKENSTC